MKTLHLISTALTAAFVSMSAYAGPDFYVIEKAREAKRADQRNVATEVHQQVVTSTTPRCVTYKQGT